jgi:crotonobetainyl-CoA:carnitine CoA-transferase CaiB-like acyl-CoA transferase
MNDKMFFKGLKVVELASVLAGPLVGSFFAELGAEVVKIENIKTKGDPTRQWKTNLEDKEMSYSAYYTSANVNKQSLFLDIKEKKAHDKIVTLVKDADIFITNLQEKKLVELKFDFDTIKKIKGDIIYAQLHAYEKSSDKPGYDMVMQAESGLISMCGNPNALAKIPVPIVDIIASHQMKEAILMAMLKRERLNEGSRVEVSLYKSAISTLSYQAANYLLNGSVAKPMGTEHPNIAPYGDIYKSKDDFSFMLTIGSDKQFEKLKNIFIFEENFGFSNNQSRLNNRKALNDRLSDVFKQFSMKEIDLRLLEESIPFCYVNNIAEGLSTELSKEMIFDGTVDETFSVKQLSNIAFEIS